MVVASMAIHITMIWSEMVTMVMVARKRIIDPMNTCSDWMSASFK